MQDPGDEDDDQGRWKHLVDMWRMTVDEVTKTSTCTMYNKSSLDILPSLPCLVMQLWALAMSWPFQCYTQTNQYNFQASIPTTTISIYSLLSIQSSTKLNSPWIELWYHLPWSGSGASASPMWGRPRKLIRVGWVGSRRVRATVSKNSKWWLCMCLVHVQACWVVQFR